jgi:hypothetical protein
LELVEDNNLIIVEPMEKLDAIALLEKKLRIQGDSDTNGKNSGISELAAALEFMPLAIVKQRHIFPKERRGVQCRST